MLSAKFRFHGHAALRFVFGHGKTFRLKSLSLRVARNPRRQLSRASVVISKKVIKSAPKRNTVRRRVYEVLRHHWDHIAPSYDLFVSIYDPNFLDMTHEELANELKKALQIARVWVDVAKAPTKDS